MYFLNDNPFVLPAIIPIFLKEPVRAVCFITITISRPTMEDKHVDDEGYDIEDQDIAIEVKDFEGVDIDLAGEEFQLIGIDDPNPILRIGDKIFEGVWGEFCVSGVVFDTEIQHQGTMTKKLIFNRVLVKSKSGENKPLPESGIDTSVILSAMHKAKNTEYVFFFFFFFAFNKYCKNEKECWQHT